MQSVYTCTEMCIERPTQHVCTLSCFSFCVLVFEGLYRSSLLGTLGSPEWGGEVLAVIYTVAT